MTWLNAIYPKRGNIQPLENDIEAGMSCFAVIKLAAERLDEVYPLIRAATHIDQRRWHAYARLLNKSGGEILAVVNPDNRIYGIASYRAQTTLRHSRGLIVDVVAAFEFHSDAPVREQLCAALKDEAQRRQCETLAITVTAPRNTSSGEQASAPWQGLDFSMETVTLVHRIEDKKRREVRQDSKSQAQPKRESPPTR